jgi:hypothetical protein
MALRSSLLIVPLVALATACRGDVTMPEKPPEASSGSKSPDSNPPAPKSVDTIPRDVEPACRVDPDERVVTIPIVVANDAVWIDGIRVDANADAVARQLAQLWQPNVDDDIPPTVGVSAPEGLSAASVLPVFEGVQKWGSQWIAVMVAVRGSGMEPVYLRLGLGPLDDAELRPSRPLYDKLGPDRRSRAFVPGEYPERIVWVSHDGLRLRVDVEEGTIGGLELVGSTSRRRTIGSVTPVGSAAELRAGEGPEKPASFPVTAVHIAADTTWGQIIGVVLATCPGTWITDRSPPA